MLPVALVTSVTLAYFGLLFAVAYYADRKRKAGQSIISNSYIYSLSLAVYFTSWTFYGSVGRAATSGLDFLPTYLGPTLIAFSWWIILRNMVRISKEQNIVSIADFIASRYGKSAFLGAVVTIFAVIGIMPYIALQLKAVAYTFDLLSAPPEAIGHGLSDLIPALPPYIDTAFIVALVLTLFGILFGARHLDASERHEGLVAAIALESLVKIVAFVSVGIFVTYGLFDGFSDIFAKFLETFPERKDLILLGTASIPYPMWFSLTFISMMAVMFLPRQFHIMVIENSDEKHIRDAMWRFPAYMFLMNLFVIPIALGGLLLTGGEAAGADYFVVSLPLVTGHPWLAMLVFIGGFSASAGMVMVESVALSTMVHNYLVMPVINRLKFGARDLSRLLINIKRLGIFAVIFLGYLYYRLAGEYSALVNIGLISFMAATQFAPAILGGLFWKRATRKGATAGLIFGFALWFYTLLLPAFVQAGWLENHILTDGLFGLSLFRPQELFGLSGFDKWTHALFWTMFFNLGAFLTFSLLTKPCKREIEQADKFINAFEPTKEPPQRKRLSGAPTLVEFIELMTKFIGEKQAHAAMAEYLHDRDIDEKGSLSEYELPALKRFTERTLAGSVGAAPARIIIENYLATKGSKMEDVFDIFGTVTLSRTASRDQLSVLYESARLVASGESLKIILDNILELLLQQFKFDLCVVRFLDDQTNTLSVVSQRGKARTKRALAPRDLNRETCIGEAFLDNKTKIENDCDLLDKPEAENIAGPEGFQSFAHAPISIEGQPIGVLSCFSRSSKGIFTEEFIELFDSLAGQIGIAWRNAQQTEDLIKAKEHERELQIAKTIQLGLLPTKTPQIDGISLAGLCVPARQVGGDYYDFLPRDDGKLDLVIADVSGHNIGAALIMAETRTFIQSQTQSIGNTSGVMTAINEFFYEDLTRAELFITMFYVKFDPITKTLIYSNAGHNPPLIANRDRETCERLDAEGLIFGVKQTVEFEEKKTLLKKGDVLLMYTDGLTEAANADGELFGEERLCQLLEASETLPPAEIIESLLNQIRLFTGNRHFNDDVSLVVLKINA